MPFQFGSFFFASDTKRSGDMLAFLAAHGLQTFHDIMKRPTPMTDPITELMTVPKIDSKTTTVRPTTIHIECAQSL